LPEILDEMVRSNQLTEQSAEEIATSEDIQQDILSGVLGIRSDKQEEAMRASEDILSYNDDELRNKIYGYTDENGEEHESTIPEQYREKYAEGIVSRMGDDVIDLQKQYSEHPLLN